MRYEHLKIEKKWQDKWEKVGAFKTIEDKRKKKYYALDMFPYPSGAGLHVGHPEGYIATDIVSRYKRMNGYNVLHPMGWDAFGLPAEQYAFETGNDPREFTLRNIETFKKQLRILGFSYDWDKEIMTCDPNYYRWTQWIFMKLYQRGLAELKDIEVNWCAELGTVLANEEVLNIDGKMVSERGNHPVIKKPMKQWVLKITEYADRLWEDLDWLDWPESIKEMQRNWIGKSVGAKITFKMQASNLEFEVFTTRADTLFGASYTVLAPEHPLVKKITTKAQLNSVNQYIDYARQKSDLERTDLNKNKTGVFTGAYAINPANNEAIPVWIADYVLYHYGTGAIMAVPAHDERDYQFAKTYGLKIIAVLDGDISQEAFTLDAPHINSAFLNGLMIEEANVRMIEHLEKTGMGKKSINYRLRDWIFSRQRYWGEPFPIVHYEDGTIELVNEDELPVKLPVMDNLKLSGTGESPLVHAKDWLEVVRFDGVKGRRETNTMPQWAGSCWYYIGFILRNNKQYLDLSDPAVQELVNYWLPVDLYIGGTEHAVLHLLYARFWHKVLYDCGIVQSKEPFQKLFNQGMILGKNGLKMSKSLGNVVNPDDIVYEYGADSFRVYEMFMGPLEATKPWSTQDVGGSRRFIERVFRFYTDIAIIDNLDLTLEALYHQTVKKVTEDIENLRFNTAISQMMIFINEAYRNPRLPKIYLEGFLKLLNPFAPHMTEELWSYLGHEDMLVYATWPKYDEAKTMLDEVVVVVQVNGKLREKLIVKRDMNKEELEDYAINLPRIKNIVGEREIIKTIHVINKLINLILGD